MEHQKLCHQYAITSPKAAAAAAVESTSGKKIDPIVVAGLEFGSRWHASLDVSKFAVPPSLLQGLTEQQSMESGGSSFAQYNILPLLRCLGISETLRLLSALLCERRIILVSKSPARLSGCAQAESDVKI